MPEFRWRLADDDGGQAALFAEEDLVERHVGRGEYAGLEFLHVNAKRIITTVPPASPVPFRHTINAYRGCSHACVYCFARPTHEYLGLGLGRDFDTKLVVKVNAVERLRAELRAPSWTGEHIAMGTNTDPYQRCEAKYHLTRGIVQTLGDRANPFSILTKSTLVLRDLDLLASAAERTEVRVNFSIGTLDEEVWRATEPGTPHPRRRVEAVTRLNAAGVACGVLVAPVLPGLSDRDEQLREVVEACVGAGAVSISSSALHLRAGVRDHYLGWLAEFRPELLADARTRFRRAYQPAPVRQDLADRVRAMVADARGRWSPPAGTRVVRPPGPAEATSPTRGKVTRAAEPHRADQLGLDLGF